MLSKTLDQTMAKAMKLENMTGKTLFGRHHGADINPAETDMMDKLAPYIKEVKDSQRKFDDEVLDYITEDPNTIVPVFDFGTHESSGLPFFVSLSQKLSIMPVAE